MDQVAHQAVVIQFILEMAANSQQDPRGCFRQFFSKAKVGDTKVCTLDCCSTSACSKWLFFCHSFFLCEDGQDVYLEVFYTELEAFKRRLREHSCNRNPEAKEAWTSALPQVRPLWFAPTRYCFRPHLHDFICRVTSEIASH